MRYFTIGILLCFSQFILAQRISNYNPIRTNTTYLNSSHSPLGQGMAEIGVVAQPYNYQTAFKQNPALLARNQQFLDINTSYGYPFGVFWGAENSYVYTTSGTFAFKEKHAIGFSSEKIDFGDLYSNWENIDSLSPPSYIEYHLSLSYAYALSPNLSLGLTGKYFKENLNGLFLRDLRLDSYAFDIGMDYHKTKTLTNNSKIRYNYALAITNIGPKVSFIEGSTFGSFIPTNLRTGFMFTWEKGLGEKIALHLTAAYQVEKFLVPTPDTLDINGNQVADYAEIPAFKGMFTSFADAPRGINEELEEISHRMGLEARFEFRNIKSFLALRAGFRQQSINKGISYGNAGLTLNIYGFYFDCAYSPYSRKFHTNLPFEQYLSFSLGFQKEL